MKKLPVSKICIGFDFNFEVPNENKRKSLTQQYMERRIKIFEYLVKNNEINSTKEHHLLGASDCVEYRFLKKYSFITTADTSSPIQHGIHNVLYRDYGLSCEKIKDKLNFGVKLNKKQINDITKNIRVVRKFSR